MRRRTFLAAAATAAALPGAALAAGPADSPPAPTAGHIEVNGLSMYYESYGTGGVPLVLLHGAFSSIHNSFGGLVAPLSANRRVIGFDLQGHGRTADIDRPMTHDNLVSDVVAALDALGIPQADLYGYSNGAAIALRVAVEHPERVRKLIVQSVSYQLGGVQPGLMDNLGEAQPSMMYETPWYAEYQQLNPKPDFDALFRKKSEADKQIRDFTDAQIGGLPMPVLLISGDNDLPTLEHTVKFYRLLGGGIFGDMPPGLPRSQLAILPGASHVTSIYQIGQLSSLVPRFLDGEAASPVAANG